LPVYLVICKHCGLLFINNPQPQEFYQDLYRNKYGFEVRDAGNCRGLDKKNYELTRWINHSLKKDAPRPRLLEIGCSSGYLLKTLEKQGYEVYGIEPGQKAVSFARKHNDLKNIENCLLEESAYRDHFFDVIVLIQTFEHAVNPVKFLLKVRGLLKDNGTLSLEVPDALAIDGVYRWGSHPSANHLYIYSVNTLNLLYKKCGFKITDLKKISGNIRIVAKKNEPSEPFPLRDKENYKRLLFVVRLNKRLAVVKSALEILARRILRKISRKRRVAFE